VRPAKIPRTLGVSLFCLHAEGSKIALHIKQYIWLNLLKLSRPSKKRRQEVHHYTEVRFRVKPVTLTCLCLTCKAITLISSTLENPNNTSRPLLGEICSFPIHVRHARPLVELQEIQSIFNTLRPSARKWRIDGSWLDGCYQTTANLDPEKLHHWLHTVKPMPTTVSCVASDRRRCKLLPLAGDHQPRHWMTGGGATQIGVERERLGSGPWWAVTAGLAPASSPVSRAPSGLDPSSPRPDLSDLSAGGIEAPLSPPVGGCRDLPSHVTLLHELGDE
jgi:hypothetical protein